MENLSADAQVHEYSLRLSLTGFLLVFALVLFGQPQLSTSNKKAQKLYLKADKKFRERDFESAIALLSQSTSLDRSFYEAYLRKGSLYNALGQEDSVYLNFFRYAKLAPQPMASVLERLAHLAFDRGHYLVAGDYLSQFLEQVPEKASDRAIALLKESIAFSLDQLERPMEIAIEEMPEAINRYKLQYLPAMTVDKKTLVYTKREFFADDEDIVVSQFMEGQWQPSASISPRVNSNANEGAATISADGRTMIFTACDRRDSYGSCDLYITRKSGEVWSRPRNLGKVVNSKYWESQPSLSADGNTLYFASNRPGGYGGRDLWVTNKEGKYWKTPKNLGRPVNSFKDETTPFIHFNGKTLFFSSNSRPGLGGFDLYSAEKQDSTWTNPQNLGYPLNTFRDEVALLVAADSEEGYFAKEIQKNREILDSKVVRFQLPDEIKPPSSYYLAGKVVDKKTGTPLRAGLQVVNLTNNETLYNHSSDSISGDFYMVLPSGKELAGYVKKKGYLYEDFRFRTHVNSGYNVDSLTIELTPVEVGQSFILKNIYFETDSYQLDERSASEIENAALLLRENPEILIEISGHTDDIGTKDYNDQLSGKRAQAVYLSLVEKGIPSARLKYVGYGDSRPLVPNSSEENRQSNRRIEFRVLR